MLNTLVFFQQDKPDFCYTHVDEWVVLTSYKHFLPHLIHHELSHYTWTWGEGGTHWSFIKGGSTQVPTPYVFISHFWQKKYPSRIHSNDKYSQLSPCRHPTITDTPITRTAAKSLAKINCKHLTEMNSRYYKLCEFIFTQKVKERQKG